MSYLIPLCTGIIGLLSLQIYFDWFLAWYLSYFAFGKWSSCSWSSMMVMSFHARRTGIMFYDIAITMNITSDHHYSNACSMQPMLALVNRNRGLQQMGNCCWSPRLPASGIILFEKLKTPALCAFSLWHSLHLVHIKFGALKKFMCLFQYMINISSLLFHLHSGKCDFIPET